LGRAPVKGTGPPPAFFELSNNLQVASTSACTLLQVPEYPVDQIAKVYPQRKVGRKIVDEVV
jgi:hypothetical protein